MILESLHRLASLIAPVTAGSVLLACTALASLVTAWRRTRGWREPSTGDQAGRGRDDSSKRKLAPLAVALGIVAAVLLVDLGGNDTFLLTWEPAVLEGLAEDLERDRDLADFTAERLLWSMGVMSRGQESLFYGVPTYALFRTVGISTFTLRLASVVASLLAVAVLHGFVRRAFGWPIASLAALVLATNPAFLYYGRYASPVAGTTLALLLALWSSWSFLVRPRAWSGVVSALALHVATLHYSPGRIVVLVLLAWILGTLAFSWKRSTRAHLLGAATILVIATVVWSAQSAWKHDRFFLAARGEQVFAFFRDPSGAPGSFGRELRDRYGSDTPIRLRDKAKLVASVLTVTGPQLAHQLAPHGNSPHGGALHLGDPPKLPLYFAPLAPFLLWGLGRSLALVRSAPHACLLLWLFGVSVPLVLTNRVDAHRVHVLLIPITIWTALGLRAALAHLRKTGLPCTAAKAAIVGILVSAAWESVLVIHPLRSERDPIGELVQRELVRADQPVLLGAAVDHRLRGWILAQVLGRKGGKPPVFMLDRTVVDRLVDGEQAPVQFEIRRLLDRNEMIWLAPASRFGVAARRFGQEGAVTRVVKGEGAAGLLIVEPPLRHDATVEEPTQPPHVASRIPLSDLEPLALDHGFAPPRFDEAWNHQPLVIGDERYERGLGMHAPSWIRYAVPGDARWFSAVVGVGASACPRGSVTFEVLGDGGELLYASRILGAGAPPEPILLDRKTVAEITLVVTDAGDGRDCDHAVWGNAAFLVESKSRNSAMLPATESQLPGASRRSRPAAAR